ncbi:MAG: YIP1 family protein [Candidatus Krumholzibacteriia bacterium]
MQIDGEQFASAPPTGPPPPPPPTLPPWEERERYGFLNALYLTTRDVLGSPERFYARVPPRGGLWQPLLFALVVGILSAFLDWMWTLAASSLRILMEEDVARLLRGQLSSGFAFIMSPGIAFATVFVQAGVVHLCLLLMDGARNGFAATFRAVAYAQAVWILAALPFCGNVVALFWGAVVTIIGLRRLHGTTTWRAVLAVSLPMIACLASCAGLALLGIAKGLLD